MKPSKDHEPGRQLICSWHTRPLPSKTVLKWFLIIFGTVIILVGAGIFFSISQMVSSDMRRGPFDDLPLPHWHEMGKYNEDISIHVDFSIPSSQHRFFVYDRKAKKILSSSKCAHGAGGGSTIDEPVFSNVPNSQCSSLGVYRLLRNDRLKTINAPCIRVEGLSSTNSNAYKRGIVIHGVPILADDITYGIPIPVTPLISQGCFAISSETLSLLQELMAEGKKIYLYAVYSR